MQRVACLGSLPVSVSANREGQGGAVPPPAVGSDERDLVQRLEATGCRGRRNPLLTSPVRGDAHGGGTLNGMREWR
jgi:hypothetical protein